jgi:phosphoglycerate dehydrogenase-like enzyme
MPKEIIEGNPNLKLIQRWGVGYDKVDIKTAGEKNIPVAIASGINSIPVAELTILLMLSLYRNITLLNSHVKEGLWERQKFIDSSFILKGKNVGLIGCGNIGKEVCRRLNAFEAQVFYYDVKRLSSEEEMKLGLEYRPFEHILQASDIVSLHLPINSDTEGLINEDTLSLMKKSALLINTSRGKLIVEEDLVKALKNKTISGAGLDTFHQEPIEVDNPLLSQNNVVLTPHIGGNTTDLDIDMVEKCLGNIISVSNGGAVPQSDLVNGQYLPEDKKTKQKEAM